MKLAAPLVVCAAALVAVLLTVLLRPAQDGGALPVAGAPEALSTQPEAERMVAASPAATGAGERRAADAPGATAEAPAPRWRGELRTAAGAPVRGAAVLLAEVPGSEGDPGPSGALDAESLEALRSVGILRVQGATLAATLTDEEGRFALDVAQADCVALLALHRAHGVVRRGPEALPAAQADADLGTLVLAANGTLEGEVRDPHGRPCVGLPLYAALEQADGGVVEGDRSDRLDAEVLAALSANGGLTVGRTQSDAEGRFRFEGLVPGRYVLEIEGRRWGSGHRGVFHTGEFAGIGDSYAVHVRVVDERGAPVSGAFGQLREVERQVPAQLVFPFDDERGYATIGAGTFQLVVAAEGAPPFLRTLEVSETQPVPDVTARLSFPRPGTVSVRIPEGLGAVTVRAARVLPPEYAERAYRSVDPVRRSAPAQDGRAVLTLAPGSWRFEGVFAYLTDGESTATESFELEVLSGRSLELELGLPDESR